MPARCRFESIHSPVDAAWCAPAPVGQKRARVADHRHAHRNVANADAVVDHLTALPLAYHPSMSAAPTSSSSAVEPRSLLPGEVAHGYSFQGLLANTASSGHSARRGMLRAAMIVSAMSAA